MKQILLQERWAVNRSFALRVFRDCGMGRDTMAQKILLQGEAFVEHVKQRMKGEKVSSNQKKVPLTHNFSRNLFLTRITR